MSEKRNDLPRAVTELDLDLDQKMRVIDMHAHLSCFTEKKDKEGLSALEELRFRKDAGIFTCFSAGTPEEYQRMETMERMGFLVSFGIHPWYAERYDAADWKEYLKNCDFIGEIGMDSVWCEVSLKEQQRQLEFQLQAAADLGKPVLLHTKGQEEQIARIIRDFPGKVCVHWFSGEERALEAFLEQDCYFTLGPDTVALCQKTGEVVRKQQEGNKMQEAEPVYRESEEIPQRQAVRRIVREVPANRLFVETDGISAVAWALQREWIEPRIIPRILKGTIDFVAVEKKMSHEQLEAQMKRNLREFVTVRQN